MEADGKVSGELFLRSGSFGIDRSLGGGYPRGQFVEIAGPRGGGKSTLALHAVAEVQRRGGRALYVHTSPLDFYLGQLIGVDPSSCVEVEGVLAGFALIDHTLSRGRYKLVVLDADDLVARPSTQTFDWPLMIANCSVLRARSRLRDASTTLMVTVRRPTPAARIPYKPLLRGAGVSIELGYRQERHDGLALRAMIHRRGTEPEEKSRLIPLSPDGGICHYREAVELALELGLIEAGELSFRRNGVTIALSAGGCVQWLRANPDEFVDLIRAIQQAAKETSR